MIYILFIASIAFLATSVIYLERTKDVIRQLNSAENECLRHLERQCSQHERRLAKVESGLRTVLSELDELRSEGQSHRNLKSTA